MTDSTWTNGSADGKASTAANWSAGIDVGYNLIFDGTSTANCDFDYAGQLGTLSINSGYTGTVTQSSDMYITGYTQGAGTFTGVATKWVYVDGDFVQSAGTITAEKIRLSITNGNINSVAFNTYAGRIHSLTINGNCMILTIGLYVPPAGEFTLNGNLSLTESISVYHLSNSANVKGTGTILSGTYKVATSSITLKIPFTIYSLSFSETSTLDITVTFNHDISINGTFSHGSKTAGSTWVFNLNGHSLTASTITIGTRGILSNSALTDSVVTCGSFDSSAGTFTEANTQVIANASGTFKTHADHKFKDFVQREKILTTLASNLTVSNELVTAGDMALAGFAITHETPGERYTAPMIYPIVRNPKRNAIFANRFTRNFEKEVV